ncbi:MAG: HEPN domain-containing protein [Deltaproteobacteria bacterium]|nr:HEPN domain-containing protein [Deltaproteobacteria bacterium]
MARGYLALARTRLKAFPVYVAEESWATVVREAHEAVELLLKAAIRWVGSEPSRTHEPRCLVSDSSARLRYRLDRRRRFLASSLRRTSGTAQSAVRRSWPLEPVPSPRYDASATSHLAASSSRTRGRSPTGSSSTCPTSRTSRRSSQAVAARPSTVMSAAASRPISSSIGTMPSEPRSRRGSCSSSARG